MQAVALGEHASIEDIGDDDTPADAGDVPVMEAAVPTARLLAATPGGRAAGAWAIPLVRCAGAPELALNATDFLSSLASDPVRALAFRRDARAVARAAGLPEPVVEILASRDAAAIRRLLDGHETAGVIYSPEAGVIYSPEAGVIYSPEAGVIYTAEAA